HVGFGMDGVKDLLETPEGRAAVEAAVPKWLRVGLASFGADRSRTNDRYRYWGFKTETNAAMRAAYYRQVRAFAVRDWGIELAGDPAVYMAAAG
ncbi:MAG: hypothetical protein OXF57_12990, partial [Rhodospirillaceae bacterium]|nr:hypothetical protein [Rhodospirillaceae bacterium]